MVATGPLTPKSETEFGFVCPSQASALYEEYATAPENENRTAKAWPMQITFPAFGVIDHP
jgi:hypothetical protein